MTSYYPTLYLSDFAQLDEAAVDVVALLNEHVVLFDFHANRRVEVGREDGVQSRPLVDALHVAAESHLKTVALA